MGGIAVEWYPTGLEVMDCARFLEDYSDFRDDLLDAAARERMERHLDSCHSCARYDQVVDRGVSILSTLPDPAPSEDFRPRLQHSLYSIDEELRRARLQRGHGGTVAGVAVLLVVIVALSWSSSEEGPLPVMQANTALAPAPVALDEARPAILRRGEYLSSSEDQLRTYRPTLYGSLGGGWLASGGSSRPTMQTVAID